MKSVYCAVRTGSLNKAVCCIYLRKNSDLCHLYHKLIGFYNRDKKCLLRGTNWVFKGLTAWGLKGYWNTFQKSHRIPLHRNHVEFRLQRSVTYEVYRGGRKRCVHRTQLSDAKTGGTCSQHCAVRDETHVYSRSTWSLRFDFGVVERAITKVQENKKGLKLYVKHQLVISMCGANLMSENSMKI